jgi:hypothetical protein
MPLLGTGDAITGLLYAGNNTSTIFTPMQKVIDVITEGFGPITIQV